MRQLQVCAQGHRWDPLANARPTENGHWDRCPVCGGAVEAFSLHSTVSPSTPTPPPAPLAMPTLPGYEVLEELGRGGMGIIYKARHLAFDHVVALKMISAGAQADASDLARFRAEGEAISHLQHPNIVQIYEVGEHNGLPFFALELMERGNLSQALAGAPLPPRYAAELIEMLARALQAAHEAGIIHRDLKPANVLLAAPPETPAPGVVRLLGTPKVSDFGLAKRLDDPGANTKTGNIVGTPNYMAPEQAQSKSQDLTPAVDVYSLGAILYECLTGRPPFRGATALATLDQVRSQDPVSPSRVVMGLPRKLTTICLTALAKEPGRRYRSAGALADDLRRFLDDEPIQARPVSVWEKTWRAVRRRPAVVGLAALTVLVTAVGIVLGARLWSETSSKAKQDAALRQREEEKLRAEEEARQLKVTYHASFVRRWGVPEGVAPLDEPQARRRDLTYKFYRREGKVEKVEAIDRWGRLGARQGPSTAVEGGALRGLFGRFRQPCRWEYERNEKGEVVKERAYDRNGQLEWVFLYTDRTTGYLTDRRGFPRPLVGSGAAFVSFGYTDRGLEKEHRYLDRNGKPRAGPDGIFAQRQEHDERGFVQAITHLGARDQPVLHPRGYARVTYKHDEQGNVVERAYFGLDGKPALHRALRWARETSRYDGNGHRLEQRSFGLDGQPHGGRRGAAATVLTYDGRGLKTSEAFFDVEGKPVAGPPGVARIAFRHDERGDLVEERFFDVEGEPVLAENGAARVVRTYDARHNVATTAYFGRADEPVAIRPVGLHKETTRYDERNNLVERRLAGVEGQPVPGEPARARYAYNAHGLRTELAYFDGAGKPVLGPDGVARATWTWDEQGNNLEQSCFGADGRPASPNARFRLSWRFLPAQYARFENVFDDRGNCTDSACYAPGKMGLELVARYKSQWDEQGQMIEMARYDGRGRLFAPQGPPKVTLTYDEQGHVIGRVAYGPDGKPLLTAGGAARHVKTFDDMGRVTAEAFVGLDGAPRLGDNGYARATFRYDEEGKLIGSSYFDPDGELVRTEVFVTAVGAVAFDEALKEGDVLMAYDGVKLACARQFIDLKRREDYNRSSREAQVLRGGKAILVRLPSGPAVRFYSPWRRQIFVTGLDAHMPALTRAVEE